jgi:hypothetical protein
LLVNFVNKIRLIFVVKRTYHDENVALNAKEGSYQFLPFMFITMFSRKEKISTLLQYVLWVELDNEGVGRLTKVNDAWTQPLLGPLFSL